MKVMRENADKKLKGKTGCMFILVALTLIWLGGGWYLWKAAQNVPIPEKKEKFIPFSFIPDDEEEEKEEE